MLIPNALTLALVVQHLNLFTNTIITSWLFVVMLYHVRYDCARYCHVFRRANHLVRAA